MARPFLTSSVDLPCLLACLDEKATLRSGYGAQLGSYIGVSHPVAYMIYIERKREGERVKEKERERIAAKYRELTATFGVSGPTGASAGLRFDKGLRIVQFYPELSIERLDLRLSPRRNLASQVEG